MKKIVNWLLGSVLMIAAVTMLSSVSANASTYYHRTPTRATARKAYYTTDTKSHTFRANGNYNRWTFRANHDLKNYRNTVWTTTQQTDIIMHGKKVRYYWVHNSKNGAAGIGNSHEGSSTTPKGVYHLSFAFGKAASARTSGMAYRQINRKSYWIEDPHDRQYNTWQN
ncbi:hypothetical protein [Lactiplantibacillus plantarum]|uniref:hypothetical protein n=1 Tax=Lactiplantibacillus plantarum TaxID=1590 RepID=UPI0021CB63F3|nr:hypothetical protein [Lactiplantibacillus plantarum]